MPSTSTASSRGAGWRRWWAIRRRGCSSRAAQKLNKMGWLEVETTFRPGYGLTYTVLREGGDADSRPRAARGARQRSRDERAAAGPPDRDLGRQLPDRRRRHRPDRCAWRHAGTKPRSSTAPRRSTRAAALPKHRGPAGQVAVVLGAVGRRSAGCTRRSRGHALPVRVESMADVKLAGSCEFSMWIDYTDVDGQPVEPAATRPSLSNVAVAPV